MWEEAGTGPCPSSYLCSAPFSCCLGSFFCLASSLLITAPEDTQPAPMTGKEQFTRIMFAEELDVVSCCVRASREALGSHSAMLRNPRREQRATRLLSRLHGTWHPALVLRLSAPALPDATTHLGISQVESTSLSPLRESPCYTERSKQLLHCPAGSAALHNDMASKTSSNSLQGIKVKSPHDTLKQLGGDGQLLSKEEDGTLLGAELFPLPWPSSSL